MWYGKSLCHCTSMKSIVIRFPSWKLLLVFLNSVEGIYRELVIMCCVLTDVFCQPVIMTDGCSFIHYTRLNKHMLSHHTTIIIPLLHKTHISKQKHIFLYKAWWWFSWYKTCSWLLTNCCCKINIAVFMVILLHKQKHTRPKWEAYLQKKKKYIYFLSRTALLLHNSERTNTSVQREAETI